MNEIDEFWKKFIFDLADKLKVKIKDSKIDKVKLKKILNILYGKPNVYINFALHANILFDDVGYCEFDSKELVWNKIVYFGNLFERFKQESLEKSWIDFEIGICSLEELEKEYPIWKFLKEKNLNLINPLYSQPFLRYIGEESNYRQFEFGINKLKKEGIPVKVFASSEHSLHPQLPQLLNIFGINVVFLTSRLNGSAPTYPYPKIIWKGLEGSEIVAFINQSGLFNGQTWHGKFFSELPSILFQIISRPDLSDVYIQNIEDLINPIEGIESIIGHISEFEACNIKFRSFTEMNNLKNCSLHVQASKKFSIEEFPIRKMYSILLKKTREIEDKLVIIESFNSVLEYLIKLNFANLYNEFEKEFNLNRENLEIAWKLLLKSENHDAFVVPFTTPGLYSRLQGIQNIKESEISISIEDYCLNLLEKSSFLMSQVLNKNLDIIKGILEQEIAINDEKKYSKEDLELEILFNMLWPRVLRINEMELNIPQFGLEPVLRVDETPDTIEQQKSFIHTTISEKIITYFDLKIKINEKYEFKLVEYSHELYGKIPSFEIINSNFKINIFELDDRLEFDIELNKNLEIYFELNQGNKIYTTYPFGVEQVNTREFHSLRFIWNGIYAIAHQYIPFYKIIDNYIVAEIPKSFKNVKFVIFKAGSLKNAYEKSWEFFYSPLKLKIPKIKINYSDNLNEKVILDLISKIFKEKLKISNDKLAVLNSGYIYISITFNKSNLQIRGFTIKEKTLEDENIPSIKILFTEI